MQISDKWRELLAELEEDTARIIVYILGAVDTGKTTLCRFLIDRLTKKFATAHIDCDPGQSLIGPPTTIGMRIYSPGQPGGETPVLRFVGSNSPQGHMLQTLSAIKNLTERAFAVGAQRVILDSSGYVLGNPAREFQFQVIDLVKPHYVVALRQGNELAGLLANFNKHPRINIRRFDVSEAVKSRSMVERQDYRRDRYREYFKDAATHELPITGLGFHGRIREETNIESVHDLLIALCDAENFVITLAVLRGIAGEEKSLRIYAPPFDPAKVATIHFGSLYLDPYTYHDQ